MDEESTMTAPISTPSFADLGLSEPLLKALSEVGYEAPTPIQAKTIPVLLEGRDLIGQAQTGTGKTAAFALPMLQQLDPGLAEVQALVLAPTRELAIQVSEAFHTYSRHLGRIGVLPIYGGQPIDRQQQRLQRGVHVVVGTPGRIMDHLRRGTLRLDNLRMVALDEADEMLKMGFLEDVEWILSQAPEERRTALFSATLPREVRRIAERHLKDPVSIEIEHKTLTLPAIEQRYLNVSPQQKIDALARILETEAT
ncbi:MAG: DEAD/DEAH box helicase, partial [Thermoanaerobaculia bacterium]